MKAFKRLLLLVIIILGLMAIWSYKPWLEDEMALSKSYLQVSNFNHEIITRGDTGKEKLVALTIDDGPDPRYTRQILNILKKYDIKATFFVVGESCEAHPELIRQEIAAGHEVENHTYTHPDLVKDNAISTEEEIVRTQHVIEGITCRKTRYLRPPKGLFTHKMVEIAEMKGYKVVLWTICVEHQKAKTTADMANRVIKVAKPGIIILAHDGRLNRTRTVEALPMVIKGYLKKGYRFVTVEELLSYQA